MADHADQRPGQRPGRRACRHRRCRRSCRRATAGRTSTRIPTRRRASRIVTVSLEGLADGDLSDVEVLLRGPLPTRVFDRLLSRCPRLCWVHSATAGVERVLTPAAARARHCHHQRARRVLRPDRRVRADDDPGHQPAAAAAARAAARADVAAARRPRDGRHHRRRRRPRARLAGASQSLPDIRLARDRDAPSDRRRSAAEWLHRDPAADDSCPI